MSLRKEGGKVLKTSEQIRDDSEAVDMREALVRSCPLST